MKPAKLLVVVFCLGLVPVRAQETVTISKSRLTELEQKAAQVDKLAAELEQARAEISRLKGEVAAKPKAVYQPALPPQVEQAIQKLPPTKPMIELPPLQKGEVVQASDLLNHYAADPAAADRRYKKQDFKIKGVITDVDKMLMVSPYRVFFRVPGNGLKVRCDVRAPEQFSKVYVSGNRERVVGETYSEIVTLARVGEEVTLQGRCSGWKDGTVIFDYADKIPGQ